MATSSKKVKFADEPNEKERLKNKSDEDIRSYHTQDEKETQKEEQTCCSAKNILNAFVKHLSLLGSAMAPAPNFNSYNRERRSSST